MFLKSYLTKSRTFCVKRKQVNPEKPTKRNAHINLLTKCEVSSNILGKHSHWISFANSRNFSLITFNFSFRMEPKLSLTTCVSADTGSLGEPMPWTPLASSYVVSLSICVGLIFNANKLTLVLSSFWLNVLF